MIKSSINLLRFGTVVVCFFIISVHFPFSKVLCAESTWVLFKNPDSVQSMEKQISETVFRMAGNRQITPYKKKRVIEDRFDAEKEKVEWQWSTQFEAVQTRFRIAFDDLSIAKSGVSAYEAAKKMLDAKKRQLDKERTRLREHDASLKTNLGNIPYEVLMGGVVPDMGKTRQQLSEVLATVMGHKAVKQVNGIEIKSLTVVQNNQVIRDMIQGFTQGHYKSIDNYNEPLEGLDETTQETTQIELLRFQVYPFATGKVTALEEGTSNAQVEILTNLNYLKWLQNLELENNSAVKEWVEKQLDRVSSKNSDVNNSIRSKMDKWKLRQTSIKQNIRNLEQEISRLESRLQDFTSISVAQAKQKWEQAHQAYNQHLQNRQAWIRKQESGSKGPTVTKGKHWTQLGQATLSALQDQSGSYSEQILVVNFGQSQEYEEKSVVFKERKVAFKVLYLTLHKAGTRIIYTASLGFKLALSPVDSPVTTKFEAEKWQRVKPLEPTPAKSLTSAIGMKFVYIQPGTFMMGSPANEPGRDDDEKQHHVTLTKGFYMQTTEVTQGQWTEVMGNNPSKFKNCGVDCPVEKVSWNDVQQFINKLNQREGSSTYRLPTEAEWEYSARAGSDTAFAKSGISELKCGYDNNLDAMGWYCGNANKKTHAVAQKQPNAWGLYDMHGNVYEWCQDWFGDYPSGTVTDPTGPSGGSDRVSRGGGWNGDARWCRSASRSKSNPGRGNGVKGFRLLRNPSSELETVSTPSSQEIDRDGHYIAYATGVVYDKNTGLEWYAGPDRSTDWNKAKRWVESLNIAGGGWRMPMIEELKTLYQEGAGKRNMTPLLKTTGCFVWSGKTKGSSSAWFFSFCGGPESWLPRGKSNIIRGFAVRSRK